MAGSTSLKEEMETSNITGINKDLEDKTEKFSSERCIKQYLIGMHVYIYDVLGDLCIFPNRKDNWRRNIW